MEFNKMVIRFHKLNQIYIMYFKTLKKNIS